MKTKPTMSYTISLLFAWPLPKKEKTEEERGGVKKEKEGRKTEKRRKNER